MVKRRYLVLDVFTAEPLAGNPLAVVLDAEGLSDEAMGRVAREFNLSETTFVLPPADPRHRARVRIFTPEHELPFAGHPTVGTAVALADGADATLVLEEAIGPVRCAVASGEGKAFAEFVLPRLPQALPFAAPQEEVAAALGIEASDIGFGGHAIAAFSAGVPYVCVPIRDLEALGRARLDVAAWRRFAPEEIAGAAASAYLYAPGPAPLDFRARMFVAALLPYEDPATGSAAAAFAGAVTRFASPGDGAHRVSIRQGVEMGRPSLIRLELAVREGRLAEARIGGHAVTVAEGTLFV